jgi:hypothetical protein
VIDDNAFVEECNKRTKTRQGKGQAYALSQSLWYAVPIRLDQCSVLIPPLPHHCLRSGETWFRSSIVFPSSVLSDIRTCSLPPLPFVQLQDVMIFGP